MFCCRSHSAWLVLSQQLLKGEGITCDPDQLTGSSHGVQSSLCLSLLSSQDEPWLNWVVCIRGNTLRLTFLQRVAPSTGWTGDRSGRSLPLVSAPRSISRAVDGHNWT